MSKPCPYKMTNLAIEDYKNGLIKLRELANTLQHAARMLDAADAINALDADGLEYITAYIGDAKTLMAEELFANSVPAFN